jgi:hypothetical protein
MIAKAITGLFKGIKRPWQVSWCAARGLVEDRKRARDALAPLLLLLLLSLLHPCTPTLLCCRFPHTHAFHAQQTNNQQITGLTSTSDFLEYLPLADEYRKHSPGCAAAFALRCVLCARAALFCREEGGTKMSALPSNRGSLSLTMVAGAAACWSDTCLPPHNIALHLRRSQPVSAIVPHDVPALVYNTRYYGARFGMPLLV